MRVPASTYRIQVTADFDLFATAGLLPYLHDLGVDWVYLSPVLQAEQGSTHGYDVVDPTRVDASRGGPSGLAAVSAEARRLGMGVLVDVVPNHLGVESRDQNPWWASLLSDGETSPYADHFDVDWPYGEGRLVLPSAENGGDLNYRRFFTVSTLAGVRVEDDAVFDATHGEIRRWFDEGLVDGLRVDHPDGLRDPREYLDRLASLTGAAYVLVEKILEPGEELPASWATAGTTGYDALALIDRVLTDPAAAAVLGDGAAWPDLIHDTKRAVADGALHPEVARIVRDLGAVVEQLSEERASVVETTPPTTQDAVAELLACFPVYRSYLPEGREHLDQAFAEARRRRPDLSFDDLEPVLSDPEHPAALRFQQTSGMVMAKGVEDCAFYRFSRLTSLNEVGGDPSVLAVSVEEFHSAMAARSPQAMTTLTTHDTKRGEDTRARITVLSEMPEAWRHAVARLQQLAPMPDPAFADLVWQAVVGAWPIAQDRIHPYVEKAMREAGDHTGWLDPDEDYEHAVHGAVDAAYDDREVRLVLDEVLERVAGPGWSNALAAKLLALTIPGVPDVYRGSELWEQSLVDPDNRRPVDFDHRAELLGAARDGATAHLSSSLDDPGLAKLVVVHRALTLRRDRPELFTSYTPLPASGSAADHVLAFDRGGAISVVTRLPLSLTDWGDTSLDLPDCVDALTGASRSGTVRLADLMADYPVALLVTS